MKHTLNVTHHHHHESSPKYAVIQAPSRAQLKSYKFLHWNTATLRLSMGNAEYNSDFSPALTPSVY